MGVVIPLDESKNKQASIKPLVDLTRADMERVNQLILSKAGSDVQMIPEVANHLISSGGKRLRPMLTLASAAMFGYEGNSDVKLATARLGITTLADRQHQPKLGMTEISLVELETSVANTERVGCIRLSVAQMNTTPSAHPPGGAPSPTVWLTTLPQYPS